MITVGILLPGSTLYPSIGADFLNGIKSCFNYHNYFDVTYKVAIIGYGLDEKEIYNESEKLLIIENADIVIAYISDTHAVKLSPLFKSTGKLLLIANSGANYPENSSSEISNTIFHNLNDSLCCFLTGKYAAIRNENKNAILATSFFDGGYRHTHSISNNYNNYGGSIFYNYVSHYKKEEFNTESLEDFVRGNPDVRNMLAVFSGDAARLFYKKVMESIELKKIQWYGSPMMFDSTPGDFDDAKPLLPTKIQGYTHWIPELNNDLNRSFIEHYKSTNNQEANLFSMHGWECALLIQEYVKLLNKDKNVKTVTEHLIGTEINSPRGKISLNRDHYILAPAYLVSASGLLDITIEETITDTSIVWQELLAQITSEFYSSWRNTYLCI